MLKRKNIKERGKIRLSEYFQKFNEDDRVSVKRELSVTSSFPERLQGRSGVIVGKRGTSYIIKLKDIKKNKNYIIHPIHLKKLKWY